MCLPLYAMRVARSLAPLILIYGCALSRLHSLRSCVLCFQHGPQSANELVDLLLRDDEWREHAQYGFMSAVENESLLQKLLHDFFPGNGEFHGEHQSFAPDVFYNRQILQFFKTLFEIGSDLSHVFQHIFVFENAEILQTRTAGQRAAAERGAMLARLNR